MLGYVSLNLTLSFYLSLGVICFVGIDYCFRYFKPIVIFVHYTANLGGGARPQKALFYLRTPSKGPKKRGFLGLFGALQITNFSLIIHAF